MYCSECGKEIPGESKFCYYCGAKVANSNFSVVQKTAKIAPKNQEELEQNEREGIRIYLHDILSLEFSINKLKEELSLAQNDEIIYDYWYYWKGYNLNPPIQNQVYQDSRQIYSVAYLSYSYSKKQYYMTLYDQYTRKICLYDDTGNEVNHQYGKPGGGWQIILDQETRKKLFTLPVTKKKLFAEFPTLINKDEVYWSFHIIHSTNYCMEAFAQFKTIIEDFETQVQNNELYYQKQLPITKEKIQQIENDISKAENIRDELYKLNIIPKKFRDLGCVYFIYDFYSSSNTPLDNIFLHVDLDKIQSQLSTVIHNQQNSILQQAIMIAQNKEMMSQNQRLFNKLSDMHGEMANMSKKLESIQESGNETSKWTRMAALNAEACAWLSAANYLK